MEETGEADVFEVGSIVAPWGKEILVQSLHYKSGLKMARLRIREGKRFTVLDVDAATARWIDDAFKQAFDQSES